LRPRWLLAVPLLLLLAWGFWVGEHLAAGVLLPEQVEHDCRQHAPDGWQEGIEVTVVWGGAPPRLECHLVHRVTGETASWDSGSVTFVPWALRWASLLAAAATVVAVVVSALKRRRDRAHGSA
jgi:hypothetical protein